MVLKNTRGLMKTAVKIGVWIDAGSRYETVQNNGTAHFLEHMAFKGTNRRSQFDLELEVENMGAHLNAYTSREQTVYYAKCFSDHLEQSIDIISDILLHSRLGEREIERERSVILREAEEVAQNMQEVVFDHLHAGSFQGSALSMTILGPDENIKSIQRSDLLQYISTHYKADRMVIAASGGISHQLVVNFAKQYFGNLSPSKDSSSHALDAQFTPCEIRLPVPEMKNVIYGAFCVEGVSWTSPDNLTMMVANTILGEWDRSRGGVSSPSRLAQIAAASSEGLQTFQAFNTCYKDTGIVGVYYVCENHAIKRFLKAVVEQWKWLAYECDESSVERAKKSLLTNLQLILDGSTPVCEDIGRQILCYGRRLSPEELRMRVQAAYQMFPQMQKWSPL